MARQSTQSTPETSTFKYYIILDKPGANNFIPMNKII